jgi:hypothetical protein
MFCGLGLAARICWRCRHSTLVARRRGCEKAKACACACACACAWALHRNGQTSLVARIAHSLARPRVQGKKQRRRRERL